MAFFWNCVSQRLHDLKFDFNHEYNNIKNGRHIPYIKKPASSFVSSTWYAYVSLHTIINERCIHESLKFSSENT